MHILLIVSHGSRREKSNQEIEQLVKNISNQIEYNFDSVMLAFLEFAKPSIVQAIDQCSRVGAKKVTVLPYFLSAGKHITKDIPQEIRKGLEQNPNLEIKVTKHFGSRDEIAQLLIKTALNAQ